uniref:Protein kinase domain-containing protein n=1 Tax=Plectus sambesii TaxID=2011161 RepID=A0A914WRZ0_9BILA
MNRLHSTTSRNNNNEIREFKHEDVDYLEEIGNGYYGEVWLVRVHDQVSGTRRVHAAKKIRSGHLIVTEDPEAISELKALKNELEIYKQIQGHPNFPQLIGVVRDDRNCCIILEYVECGDLCSFLQQKAEMGMVVYQPVGDDDFDENTIFNRQEKQMRWKQKIGPEPADGTMTTSILVYIALQAALALKFLVVNLKILHRDTAARNVLIKDDYVIKITDFGLARNANYTGESSVAFPFATWALELLKTPSMFTEKTEVWQYGVLLCEIFSMGKKPYEKLLAAAKAAAAESGKNFSPKTAIEEFLERGGRLEAPQIMPNPM